MFLIFCKYLFACCYKVCYHANIDTYLNFSYAPDEREDHGNHQEELKPKILLMGMRRYGNFNFFYYTLSNRKENYQSAEDKHKMSFENDVKAMM